MQTPFKALLNKFTVKKKTIYKCERKLQNIISTIVCNMIKNRYIYRRITRFLKALAIILD